MEYREFLEHVREYVQKRGGAESRVRIAPVLKNNKNRMDTMTILNGDGNIAPAIYMDPYYQQYLKGDTVEQIAERILEFHNAHAREGRYDLSFYEDFSEVRKRVTCRLVNYEKNRESLAHMPHRRFLDLAVVYYYRLEDETFGKACIVVNNEHMKMWDADPEELDDAAMSNTIRMLPYECLRIDEMLRGIAGIWPEQEYGDGVPMYVLTNTEKNFGAAVLLYDSVLEAVGERLGGDFFILPSSVHECMLIPAAESMDPGELQKMVREINEGYVAEEEVLGDSVYRYERESGRILQAAPGGSAP